jgi:NAD(P)H-dependent FMN reductase
MDRREFLGLAAACALSPLPARRSFRPTAARPKLVLVHGRGQQGLNPSSIRTEWLDTLARGATAIGRTLPSDLDVALPFYGDLLDTFTRQVNVPLTTDVQMRGAAQDDEFLIFQSQFAEAVRRKAGITDEQLDKEYGPNPAPRGPLNWAWVQATLRAVDKYGGGMNQATLETFTRDVFLYTTKAGVRDQIDRVVAAALTEAPTVVVAHSLGTVVAFSVLGTDRRSLHVPQFVTVGSPLAVRAVRDQFLPLRTPDPIRDWYNAFDPKDVVALYPLDAQNFPVTPAIQNNTAVKNHTDNHHGIVGYLDDPGVARSILEALGA